MTVPLFPLFVFGATGVVLLALLRWGRPLFTGTRSVDESFWCPWKRRHVDAAFRIDAWDAHHTDVERCTAFTPPTAIKCDKHCLDRHALRAAGAWRR